MSAIHRQHFTNSLNNLTATTSTQAQSSPVEAPMSPTQPLSSTQYQQSHNNKTQSSPPPSANITMANYDDHWTYEQIVLKRVPGISLGFCVGGGCDNPIFGNNTSIFVTKITQGGLAELDGRLRVNDILFKVNDTLLEDVEHSDAVQALRNAGKVVSLVSNLTLLLKLQRSILLQFP